jgi:hypothetical protein
MAQDFHLIGKTVRLIKMNDPLPVPPGTLGQIFHIDSLGQYHIIWENGRRLAVIPGVDEFTFQDEKDA